MPKKLQYLLPILPACGGLIAQLDAHPFGGIVFAVIVLAICLLAPGEKR
ncbi:hypothetical protein PQR67_25840 [Paraburkholderia fungorum]